MTGFEGHLEKNIRPKSGKSWKVLMDPQMAEFRFSAQLQNCRGYRALSLVGDPDAIRSEDLSPGMTFLLNQQSMFGYMG